MAKQTNRLLTCNSLFCSSWDIPLLNVRVPLMQDKVSEPPEVPENAYANASGTMIINAGGDTAGYGYADAMDTVVVASDGGESSDYLAALRAAAADNPRCGF